MTDEVSCMQCGWKGNFDDLGDAMGFDVICPYCGSLTEEISSYIPPTYIRVAKRVLYFALVKLSGGKGGRLFWKYNHIIKHLQ